MISPFLAPTREKRASELFPGQSHAKISPEGEKKDRFARLLHNCEEPSEIRRPKDGPESGAVPASAGVLSGMLQALAAAAERSPEEQSEEEPGLSGAAEVFQADILSLEAAAPETLSAAAAGMTEGGKQLPDELQQGKESPNGLAGTEPSMPRPGAAASSALSLPGEGEQDAGLSEKAVSLKGEGDAGQEIPAVGPLSGRDENAGKMAGTDGRPEESIPAAVLTEGPADGQQVKSGPGGQENASVSSLSGKESLLTGSRNGEGEKSGEKGESKQSFFAGNNDPEAALFAQRQEKTGDGMRPEKNALSGGFPKELALAGRGGAALEEGMNNVVRFMRTEGHHRASMIVDPPALGRVEIELTSTAGGVEASIRVGNEQLRQVVQDQITLLRTHLQQQGVQVAELTVDIRDSGKEGNGGGRGGAKGRNVRGAARAELAEDDIPSFAVDLEQGFLHWVA